MALLVWQHVRLETDKEERDIIERWIHPRLHLETNLYTSKVPLRQTA